jgi:probable F420-dependent oxidoreductase
VAVEVKFGLNLQLDEYSLDLAVKTATLTEELGCHAVFVNDHYMKPPSENVPRTRIPDAFLTLTAIACKTSRVKLGTAVTPIPFRPAPQTAKGVATLDNIAGGRVLFGVGAGWHRAEFAGYGVEFLPPGARVSQTLEGIRLMKRMWTQDHVTFHGRYYRVEDAVLQPKPIQQPHPPILIGSTAPRMCRFAAREGDGWIPGHLPPAKYDALMRRIVDEAERCGRRRGDLLFAHCVRLLTGPHMDFVLDHLSADQIARIRERHLIGPPEICVERIREYLDLGVDLMLLRLHHIAQTPFAEESKHLQQLTFIRDEILSQI